MNAGKILLTLIVSIITVLTAIILFTQNPVSLSKTAGSEGLPVDFSGGNDQPAVRFDFTEIAATAIPAVVHVHARVPGTKSPEDEDSENGTGRESHVSGSGVILSSDGYIVTNKHVIEGADEITVMLSNHKSYPATITGSDAASDLAVLKIDGQDLPFLLYANSDTIRAGQWVLAIGYPLNLDETATAGIISAKKIQIAKDKTGYPLTTFIQTDAAINLGNSGGALLNTDGRLIGINTAILSSTGAYEGYGYAIPVNTVQKIVHDIIKFGSVQKPTAANTPKEKAGEQDDELTHWLLQTGG